MFNQPIFIVLTLSLCAIIAPVASKTIFGRNNFQSSFEEPFDSEADDHHEHDTFVGVDDKDKSEEFFYVDATLLGQEVAKVDYVPPPKYVYETTNEKLTKPINNSKIYADNEVQQDEDRLFHSDEELKTDEEREQERLHRQPIIIHGNSKEVLDEPAREFEIHQDTDIDDDLNKALDFYGTALQAENHQHSDEHDKLNNRFYSTLGVENHQNIDDFDEALKKALDYYDTALQAENHQNSDEHDELNNGFDSALGVGNHQNTDIDDSWRKIVDFYDTL